MSSSKRLPKLRDMPPNLKQELNEAAERANEERYELVSPNNVKYLRSLNKTRKLSMKYLPNEPSLFGYNKSFPLSQYVVLKKKIYNKLKINLEQFRAENKAKEKKEQADENKKSQEEFERKEAALAKKIQMLELQEALKAESKKRTGDAITKKEGELLTELIRMRLNNNNNNNKNDNILLGRNRSPTGETGDPANLNSRPASPFGGKRTRKHKHKRRQTRRKH